MMIKFKRVISIVLCIVLMVTLFPTSVKAQVIETSEIVYDSVTDTYTETVRIYSSDISKEALVPDSKPELFKGSRPKKWIIYDVRVTNPEWTDYSKKLGVVKAINGSSVTASATAIESAMYTSDVSIPVSILNVAVGYKVTKSVSISGSATGNIPKGYKVAVARGYPVYEVRSFKAKLVHSIIQGTVYKRGSGTTKKPIGIEIVFQYTK